MYGNDWWFWFPLAETTVRVDFEPNPYGAMYFGTATDEYGYNPDNNDIIEYWEKQGMMKW